MNVTIRELMLDAISKTLNGADIHNDVDKMYIPNSFVEHFTELIVQECFSTLDEISNDYVKLKKTTPSYDEKAIFEEGIAACHMAKYKIQKNFMF